MTTSSSSTARVTDAAPAVPRRTAVAYGAVVVVAGLNLRDPITSISATLDAVADHYGLSAIGAAGLSSLPVLLLAAGAPLAPVLVRRLGVDRALLALAALLTLAVALRPIGTVALFVGTVAAGAAISGISVLMPQVIREHLAARAAIWSGVFSTSFGMSAAIGAAFTVPLVSTLGSLPLALASWAGLGVLLTFVAAVVTHQRRRADLPTLAPATQVATGGRLRWQVTAFFGAQAFVFFAVVAWLPTLYVDRGADPEQAAGLLAWLSIAGLPASLIVSITASRMARQHVLVAIVAVATAVGLAGVAWAPLELAGLFVTVLGVAQGGAFGLALLLVVLKSQGSVASFSAFAQGFGYAFAALGPLALGILHTLDRTWSWAIVLLIAVVAGEAVAGWAAGRRTVALRPERAASAATDALTP